jgi:hypothetical protein
LHFCPTRRDSLSSIRRFDSVVGYRVKDGVPSVQGTIEGAVIKTFRKGQR